MVKTKQMARKESGGGSGMQRAKFPAEIPQSEDLPSSPSRIEDTEPRADTENSEAGPGDVEPAASTSQQWRTPIVLPRINRPCSKAKISELLPSQQEKSE